MQQERDSAMRENSASGPDFLIVGGQRCATTWLANNLRAAQGVWIPPIKELHYFDQQVAGWRDRRMRQRVFHHLGKRVKAAGVRARRCRAPGLGLWDLNYFGGRRNDRWYAGLFTAAQRRGLKAGEATPAYALLDEPTLERIRRMNPEVRLIFVMRDPVERAWSGVNNSLRKNRRQTSATLAEKIELGTSRTVIERSRYAATVERLERVFGQDQILYGFYDQLSSSPRWFVEKILRHIGIGTPNAEHVDAQASNASGAGSRAPEAFRQAIAPYLIDDVEKLCSRFGEYPCRWLEGVATDER